MHRLSTFINTKFGEQYSQKEPTFPLPASPLSILLMEITRQNRHR